MAPGITTSVNSRSTCVPVSRSFKADSALSARLTGTPEAIERNSKMNPMGVVGEGEDSAALIDLLLSDQARWITAQQIGVDGGQAVIHPLPKG